MQLQTIIQITQNHIKHFLLLKCSGWLKRSLKGLIFIGDDCWCFGFSLSTFGGSACTILFIYLFTSRKFRACTHTDWFFNPPSDPHSMPHRIQKYYVHIWSMRHLSAFLPDKPALALAGLAFKNNDAHRFFCSHINTMRFEFRIECAFVTGSRKNRVNTPFFSSHRRLAVWRHRTMAL